ncbi:serine hydrolase domain-containing protein [Gellertiella hungarica]|uniref:Beta-lactamase-related domain-containing protein n=1 Tax=Gellertiella hungarica TaxID=1572859 RepID=A0A7W6NJQ8_9HYPH|nr:serine hydrolase [Gellertiella hungarica]MBB4063532.1 hypothetical protein [Gellertiella hungarica]
MLGKMVRGLFLAMLAVFAGLLAWLYVAPPELLLVGDSYSAKIVCSNRFIAGRDPAEVMAVDVQAPGHPLLKFVSAVVDEERKTVTTRIFGFFAESKAAYRDGLGCTNLPRGYDLSALSGLPQGPQALPKPSDIAWPAGDAPLADGDARPELAAPLADGKLLGPGIRAVVVIKDGKLVGEHYAPGFTKETPLLGWSMTKSVNAAIAGRLMAEGRLSFDDANLLPEWAGDERKDIRLRDLMGMESGLRFNEDYGDVSDVTRMLYLEPDMAGFAAGQPSEAKPGTTFRYSTGTSVLIARIWMNRIGDFGEATAYPQKALFAPLGMTSAVLETDVTGTLVGGSYLYATARDWARFGQFLLQDGVWNGTRLLSEEYMQAVRTPSRASGGLYSGAQTWIAGPDDKPSSAYGLPEDTIWLQGHDGQTVAIIPSQRLVVVRMGLTPSKLGWVPQPLVKAIADALD